MASSGGFYRGTTVTRVVTATTTTTPLGAVGVSIYIKTSGGTSSPTVNGTAAPYSGLTLNIEADSNNFLNPVTIVTSAGDEVLITTVQ